MELLKQPSLIHPAYNPVVFAFKGIPYTTETIYIVAGNENIPLEIDFDDSEIGEVEISGILKSLFGKMQQSRLPVIVDGFQSFTYKVQESLSSINGFGTYTAVRSASQIRELQDLAQLKGKLLTGFDKLYAFEGYPADVSILGDNTTHCGEPLIINRINRLTYHCSDLYMPVLPECSFEWSEDNTVCQVIYLIRNIPYIHPYFSSDFMTVRLEFTFDYPTASDLTFVAKIPDHCGSGKYVEVLIPAGTSVFSSEETNAEDCPFNGGIDGSGSITPVFDSMYYYGNSYRPTGEETGNSLSLMLKYRNNRTGEETVYNILDPINSLYPAITVEQYKLYTDEQVKERAQALINSFKCNDYIINNDVVIINGCIEINASVIGYDVAIDFGNENLIISKY